MCLLLLDPLYVFRIAEEYVQRARQALGIGREDEPGLFDRYGEEDRRRVAADKVHLVEQRPDEDLERHLPGQQSESLEPLFVVARRGVGRVGLKKMSYAVP